MVPKKEPNMIAIITPNDDQLKPPVPPPPLPTRTRERTRTRILDSQTSMAMMRMKNAIKQIVRGIVSDAFDANRLSVYSNNFEFLKSQCAAGFIFQGMGILRSMREYRLIGLNVYYLGISTLNFPCCCTCSCNYV